MPELPEVQTIVSDLSKILPGLKIAGAWTDWQKLFRQPIKFEDFQKEILGRKIGNIRRRGKFILIDLDKNKTLVIHQRLTGHLLYGKWEFLNKEWKNKVPGPLAFDLHNRFLHLVLNLSNGNQLALSDLRKFAKILIWPTDNLSGLKEIKELGPEPLDKDFTYKKFKEVLVNKRGRIKQVLMDQSVIAGIGNIYSDEILWSAEIHPLRLVQNLNDKELRKIYGAMPKVLNAALKAGGDSISDYRRPSGEKGNYQNVQNAYQMEGIKCKKNDGGIIKKIKIGGRSAHFCPTHQKL